MGSGRGRTTAIVCLALLGTLVGAKPPWTLLPSLLTWPYFALPLVAAGFLSGPVSRKAVSIGAAIAGLALSVSVAWYTVAEPLWLPGLLAQTPAGFPQTDLSLGTLVREGLFAGFGVAMWAVVYYGIGVAIETIRERRSAHRTSAST